MGFERSQSSGNFSWSDGSQKLEVRYQGSIEFTDDDSDVKAMSPNGFVRIREGGWISSRAVEFKADSSGAIERRYFDGRTEKPFVPDGKAWLSQVLPKVIRQTGFGAERRVSRIYKAKGVAGVLAEINLIEGSWAKRVYFSELLKNRLDSATVAQVLEQAGRQIDSDFELASLLKSSTALLADDATRRAYFNAARSIESDFEMRGALSAALQKGPVSPDIMVGILDASTSIDSDFEEASLLDQVAKVQPLDARTRPAFLKALATVTSDFERRRVVSAVVKADPTPETLAAMLDPSVSIGSDFEQASFLVEVAKLQPVDSSLRAPFFAAVSTVDSSFERGRVLQAVAKRPNLAPETLVALLRAAQAMGSNFETGQVLQVVAATHKLSGEARDVYVSTAERLGDFEQGRALTALVKSERR
jgi:hypothetical protein